MFVVVLSWNLDEFPVEVVVNQLTLFWDIVLTRVESRVGFPLKSGKSIKAFRPHVFTVQVFLLCSSDVSECVKGIHKYLVNTVNL
jgi:hypothetical protein